jgi:hypothetical protein
VIYVLDALVLGQGCLALLVTLAMLLVALLHMGRGILGDWSRLRFGVSMALVYVVMFVSTYDTVQANNMLAQERADAIVAALGQYKEHHGVYPKQLGDLVPDYMDTVPSAKRTLLFNHFLYYYDRDKKDGFLMYAKVPPFGRPTYVLKTETWMYLD